jgi:hypothetical protein
MPKPVSRRDLVRRPRALGWTGPYSGKRHVFMRKDGCRVFIPNPHGGDIDWSLTKAILDQAGITREEWDATA